MKNKILIQLLIVIALISAAYVVLETALTFLIAVVLIAFIIWRSKIRKSKIKKE